AVREGIVRLLRARLSPGGLLLIGYNALPGYADCIALQRLLFEASRRAPGGEAGQAAAGLAVLEHLRDMGCPYLPRRGVLGQIIATARAAPAYMAHEWFTPFWRPVFHADLARDLAAAGLEYGGSARPGVSAPALQLTPPQRAALEALDRLLPRPSKSPRAVLPLQPLPAHLAVVPVAVEALAGCVGVLPKRHLDLTDAAALGGLACTSCPF
ncbi:methyltransferase regulatory domain-containing protein, partial [Nostoc sp. NIES-2111]